LCGVFTIGSDSVNLKSILAVLCLLVLFANNAFPASTSIALTARQLPNKEYEAVITFSSLDYCIVEVNTPSDIQISTSEVLIESPEGVVLCIGKAPPEVIIEETANIGYLEPGNYTVSWTQGRNFSLSTQLLVSRPDVNPIPLGSPWALILLVFGILAVVRPALRLSHERHQRS